MNKAIIIGRLTRDPEVRYSQAEKPIAIARYTLAVNRRNLSSNSNDEQTADFINCVAFGRLGEFAERYFRKGIKILVSGRIQTGSYVNKDGVKVYTTEIVVEDQEFCEKKTTSGSQNDSGVSEDGFMSVPDGIEEELPFT